MEDGSEASIAARIEAARQDADELGRIADELQSLPGAAIARLRLHAIMLRRKAKDAAGIRPQVPPWLARLGLPAIDGRSLYRYCLSDGGFEQLERDLSARKAELQYTPSAVSAAQFVLWAAEWFRRRYDGKALRWDAVGEVLGMAAEQHQWRRLADHGLQHWRIPPLRLNGMHYRLAAIARQGGFPLAAIEGQGAGWAPRFLERLVGQLLRAADPTLEMADGIAAELMDLVPETWRNAEIRVVSAELAVEVVRLRRLVEAAGLSDGALASAWLDANRDGWREELPIGVSGAIGRALIDGLMKTTVLGGGSGSVKVERRLVLTAGGRRERVSLSLHGELRDGSGAAIARTLGDAWNRLRLVPSGRFAQFAAGELATAEPGDGGAWIVRPSLASPDFDVPADVAVTAELRGAGQRVGEPFVLSGGEAVTAAVRIYAEDPGGPGDATLRLVGTGSGGYRPERLHIDINADWQCAAHGEVALVAHVAEGSTSARALWSVDGSATLSSPRGDRYLVRAGQKGDTRDRLTLTGRSVPGCSHHDGTLPLFLGPPTPHVFDGGRERSAGRGELWWREMGTREWQTDLATAGAGACEFAWRDAVTGHIRALVAAVILPVTFALERRRGPDWTELSVDGWPGRVEIDGGIKTATGWRFSTRGSARAGCTIRLLGSGDPITLTASLPHLAWIHDWKNGPMERDAHLSLSTIHHFVARTEGRCELLADLIDRNRRPVAQATASWWVEGELPLSTIRDDLAALLRPHADLDATVKLNFNDSHDNFWYVSEFDHRLEKVGRGWVPSRAAADDVARIVGRALHQPAIERDFGAYGIAECINHRPFELPTLFGDWIVYLRATDRVLSRPRLIRGYSLANAPNTPLSKAMALGDLAERRAALLAAIDAVSADPFGGRDTVRAAVDLALSLNGLPPSTFDVLSLLPERPLLATFMLFQATAEEVEPILRLADGLPLAWSLVPADCWDAAAQVQGRYLLEMIPDQLQLVATIISDRRKLIAEREPALAHLLGLQAPIQPLFEVANAFLNRSDDRVQSIANPFRPSGTALLPGWHVDESFWRALDAPVAAALASHGQIALEPAEITCIKDIARRHPRWFRDGFRAAFRELN